MKTATITTPQPEFTRNIPWPDHADFRRGNWADNPCFYVSCIDGERTAILAGPYRTHQEALDAVAIVKLAAEKVDIKAFWYAYGTCKAPNGWREGSLNSKIGL